MTLKKDFPRRHTILFLNFSLLTLLANLVTYFVDSLDNKGLEDKIIFGFGKIWNNFLSIINTMSLSRRLKENVENTIISRLQLTERIIRV